MTHTLRSLLLSLTLATTAAFGCASSDTGEPSAEEPTANQTTTGTKPVLGPDGVPVDCNILYDGLCYKTMNDAAKAAGKDPAKCVVLESYPGQLSCDE